MLPLNSMGLALSLVATVKEKVCRNVSVVSFYLDDDRFYFPCALEDLARC